MYLRLCDILDDITMHVLLATALLSLLALAHSCCGIPEQVMALHMAVIGRRTITWYSFHFLSYAAYVPIPCQRVHCTANHCIPACQHYRPSSTFNGQHQIQKPFEQADPVSTRVASVSVYCRCNLASAVINSRSSPTLTASPNYHSPACHGGFAVDHAY